jgi:hypothetical protein
MLSSCVWTSPETPANAAIHIVGAIQTGDEKTLSQNICSEWTQEIDLSDPASLGPLEPMIETLAVKSAHGGASEYPGSDSLDIAADHAWTEIDLLTEDPLDREVWRLHMVRENGLWKVCDLEFRPGAPTPPADVGSIGVFDVQRYTTFGAHEPEELRQALVSLYTWDHPWGIPCAFDNDGETWEVVAVGYWYEKQPNGAYRSTLVEANADVSRTRAYTLGDCEMLATYP